MKRAWTPRLVRLWPFLAVAGVLLLATGAALRGSLQRTDGHLVYALDDAYIHMAMAKNMALHGLWSIDGSGFTSSSSSPAWTLLLSAAFRGVGIHESVPFVLNVILAVALAYACFCLLRRISDRPVVVFVTLLFAMLAFPLPALIFSGMEHILHALALVVLLLLLSPEILEEEPRLSSRLRTALVAVVCLVLPLIRLESMFVTMPLALWLLWRRRSLAIVMVVASTLPVLAYGAVSLSHGWFFLPNSIVMNSAALNPGPPGLRPGPAAFVATRAANGHWLLALALTVIAAITLLLGGRLGLPARVLRLLQLFCIAAVFHLTFSSCGAFYRYEAYLLLLGFLAMAAGATAAARRAAGARPSTALSVLAGVVFAGCFALGVLRAGHAMVRIDRACANIYQQQYQMGMFIRQYYDDATVVLNDIGAVGFLSNARIIDVCGLSSMEFARAGLEGRLDQQTASALVDSLDGDVALVYRSPEIPRWWTEAGTWAIPDNVVCWRSQVSLLSCSPAGDADLCRNLQEFGSRLPDEVDSRLACP